MADSEHKNAGLGVFYSSYCAVVADPVPPKFAETIAFQRLAERPRIVERSDSVAKEAKNPACGV
jgi:hypothetical protein